MSTKAQLREALDLSMLALDDMLHLYAPEEFDRGTVARTTRRVRVCGGAVEYILAVQQMNREAIGE